MTPQTQRLTLTGPAGTLQAALDLPATGVGSRGLALICHPHPLHGGTLDNKVVTTLARAALALGWRTLRFNTRGTGSSQGQWDGGRGELDDAAAALAAVREPGEPLLLAGFSFGGSIASRLARDLGEPRLVLVGPAVVNFEVAPPPPATLVVHGEADDVVPLAAVLDWARPLAQPVTVVPGAGHFFHGQLPLLKELVQRHLAG
jgi:alpha/beta superfamily hydrolase